MPDIREYLSKIKESINLEKGWLPFLNANLKWGVAFFMRTMAVICTIIIILLFIKWSGIVKDVRTMVMRDVFNIKQKDTKVISYPGIDYGKDLEQIDIILQMLREKKREEINAEKTD